MAITNFIPEIWSNRVLKALRERTTAMQLCTTEYEGEISGKGDKINIAKPLAVNVRDYDGSDITLDTPNDDKVTLTIDQARYIGVIIDRTKSAKSPYDLSGIYMQEGNDALADDVDRVIYENIAQNAHADNTIDTVVLTASNIASKLKEARKLLMKSKVSKTSRRFAGLTADEIDLLLGSSEFTRASELSDEVLMTGQVGRIYGFDIIETENIFEEDPAAITTGDPVHRLLPFGVYGQTAFANAIPPSNVEVFKPEKRFADAIKALHLYGLKVLEPKAIGVIKADTGVNGTA